ncbi:type II secretion system F family protein [Leptothrix sp. BB-4]
MEWMQWLWLALVFVFVTGGTLALARRMAPDRTRSRLDTVFGESRLDTTVLEDDDGEDLFRPRWRRALDRLAGMAAPTESAELSKAKQQFLHAGLRKTESQNLYYGVKALLTFSLPVLGLMVMTFGGRAPGSSALLMVCLVLAAAGFYVPAIVLNRMTQHRQRDIFEAFPDALDLMTVCVEAGLGLESAMTRVADDLRDEYPVLSEELRLVNLELRAGADRELAMRNLGRRTGVPAVESFVTMILQAERFGTSIAASLRVLSDQLRTKRRQTAEEKASKIGLKMLIPLILCIFPALMVILMGPAALNVMSALGPMLNR